MYSNKLLFINDISRWHWSLWWYESRHDVIFTGSFKRANLGMLKLPHKMQSCWSLEWTSEINIWTQWRNQTSMERWRFFRLILKLCPQRQVRHPFVHDLQDCWQTQRHLYISESARDQWPSPAQIHYPIPLHYTFSHLYTGSLVQTLPTTPNPTPRTWWQHTKKFHVVF